MIGGRDAKQVAHQAGSQAGGKRAHKLHLAACAERVDQHPSGSTEREQLDLPWRVDQDVARRKGFEDLRELLRRSGSQRLLAIFRLKCFRWLTPLIGAIIVASPLPDEIGLALMGLSGLRTAMFLPLSFILNFFGILAVGLAVRAVGS